MPSGNRIVRFTVILEKKLTYFSQLTEMLVSSALFSVLEAHLAGLAYSEKYVWRTFFQKELFFY